MKNKLKLILSAFILAVLLPSTVYANNCKNPDAVFYIERPQNGVPTGMFYGSTEYLQNIYQITDANNNKYPTFCLDAGRTAPAVGAPYKCQEEFDINSTTDTTKRAYYAAMIKAYEVGKNSHPGDIIIMQAAMRFITYEYNQNQSTISGLTAVSSAFTNWKTSFYGKDTLGSERLQAARNIAYAGIQIGNRVAAGETYESLVSSGEIWGDKWIFRKVNVPSKTTSTSVTYRIFIKPDFNTSGVDIDYPGFQFITENATTKVTLVQNMGQMQEGPGTDKMQAYDVTIDVSNWDGKNMKLKMASSLYSPESGMTNMIKVMPASGSSKTSTQTMLIISPGTPIIINTPEGSRPYRGGSSHYVPTDEDCIEENGKMYYVKYKNGNETSRREVTDYQEMKDLQCPIGCKIIDKDYICKDGLKCDKDKYEKECDANPPTDCDDLDPDSEEYIRKCTDACKPTITLPTRCTEFNQTSTISGSVTDINETKKEIKACVVSSTNTETTEGTKAPNYGVAKIETELSKSCPNGEKYGFQNWSTTRCCVSYEKGICKTKEGREYGISSSWWPLQGTPISDAQQICVGDYVGVFQGKSGNYYCATSINEANNSFRGHMKGYTRINSYTISSYTRVSDELKLYGVKQSDIDYSSTPGSSTTYTSDKNDAAGNSFLIKDPNQSEVIDNPYCKVSCKEKYDFKLPTAQYTESGGYFTLSTTIDGTRDCYTSEIDFKKFESDLETKRKIVIDRYNDYANMKAAAAIAAKEEDSSCHGSGDSWINPDGSTGSCSSCDATGKVVTKEWSYTGFNYDGSSKTVNNSYSDGSKASCGTCSCSGSIGHNPDTDHRNARDNAKRALEDAIKSLEATVKQYDDCTNGWENDMKFAPTIDFDYEEDYQSIPGLNTTFDKIGGGSPSHEDMYCSGDTNNQYTCQSGKSSTPKTQTVTKFVCDANGCANKTYTVSNAKWVQKSVSNTGEYAPAEQFLTYNPYGTIVLDTKDNTYKLYTKLPEGSLPIGLGSSTGIYNYRFTFGNMGQFNDTNELGRLIGTANQNSVYKAVKGNQAGYVCQYILNCDDCDYECVGDSCDFTEEECNGDGCTHECINCIFDGNNSTLMFRPFSLNNAFSNEYRTVGENWKTEKGKATKAAIENKGEDVYAEPDYQYYITKEQQGNIRDFNKKAGSYANVTMPDTNEDALINVPLKVAKTGKTYNNVAFKSVFLNIGSDNKYNYFTEKVRNSDWIAWPDSSACSNKSCTVDRSVKTGPSWK